MEKTRLSKEERIAFKQKVIDTLFTQSIFEGFKYIKTQEAIVKKTKFGYQKVPMYFHWESYSREKQALAIEIMNIGYFTRFDVLHQWFEKFNIKPRSSQKSYPSIARTTTMMDLFQKYPTSYDFVYSGEDFEKNLEKMVKDIVEVATYFFNKYRSLEDLYEELIVPVLGGTKELPNVGADWIFEYLTLTKLVNNDNYEELKQLILSREGWMNNEPNIVRYKDKLDEIFEYLETLELEMPPAFPPLPQ